MLKKKLVFAGLGLVMLLLGISFVWPAKQKKNAVTFHNLTQSLNVTSFDGAGEVWRIHLRNDNPKRAVTAFTIHVGTGQFAFPDFAISGGSIPPGGTFNFDAPVKPGHQGIDIMCAVFDDPSSEGDYSWAQATFDRRAGYILGFKKINALLEFAGDKPNVAALRDAVANLHELDPITDWYREGGKGKRQIAMLGSEYASIRDAIGGLLKQNQLALEHLL